MPDYQYARKYDAGTGEVLMNGASWATDRPLTAIALRVLRTPLGCYLPDPNFGVDYSKFDKARPNAGADIQAAIKRAFDFLTRTGQMRKLKVTTPTVAGGTILFNVSFIDPKDPGTPARIAGTLSSGQITQLQVQQ